MPADHPALAAAALDTGADVPVCLASKACVMRGVGEILSAPIALPALPAVLVNPGVPLSTRDVFKAFAGMRGSETPLGDVPDEAEALFAFLDVHGNDLTAPAIACAPAVGEVLDTLAGLPGVRIARMSGSGPTCFALFGSAEEAEWAARQLQAARPAWWVAATRLGNALLLTKCFLNEGLPQWRTPLKLPALRGSVAPTVICLNRRRKPE